MNTNSAPIGLQHFSAKLGKNFLPLESLPLQSSPQTLRELGFTGAYFSHDMAQDAFDAAQQCLEQARLAPSQVDLLIWASALPESQIRQSASTCDSSQKILNQFCYQSSWLQEALGLQRAAVTGVAQQGCASFFSALRQARALLHAEPELNHILCVGADAFPEDATREVIYNVISDAACACLISRGDVKYRWLGFEQITCGYYWDVPSMKQEILASYFPSAARVIRRLFTKLHLPSDAIDWIIPTGVNAASWNVLMQLCEIPQDRLFIPTQRFGHTVCADSFLMLEQAEQAGKIQPGMKLLLFSFGFGSTWSALILEATNAVLKGEAS